MRKKTGCISPTRYLGINVLHEDFAKGWIGIVFAIIGPGYDKTNTLLNPSAPLTVKNKLDMFSPVKDAELMDFGFIQSDFF